MAPSLRVQSFAGWVRCPDPDMEAIWANRATSARKRGRLACKGTARAYLVRRCQRTARIQFPRPDARHPQLQEGGPSCHVWESTGALYPMPSTLT